MPFEFTAGLQEVKFTDLNEALAYLDSEPVKDTVVSAHDISLVSLGELRLGRRKAYPMTQSAFVQLVHFLGLQWRAVKDEEPDTLVQELQQRLGNRQGDLMIRSKRSTVQAVLSPAYTPLTNADVLRSAQASLDLSNAQVTTFRGHVRITGVSESVTFQPEVGDIISGGWELTNNEFGKGALCMNQFLLRLVCTNGAVVQSGKQADRYVHRGWGSGELSSHIGTVGAQTISRMDSLNESLRKLTQTRIGRTRFAKLSKEAAPHLGRKGLEAFKSDLSPESTLYDAYNHLTFVSQHKSLGPRRELELVAGNILNA